MLNTKLNKNNRLPASFIKTISLVATVIVCTLNMSSAVAAGDASRGQDLSQTCLGCHGAPGLRNPGPVYSIPMLGGQSAEYLVAALKAYKAGADKTDQTDKRSHKTMQAQAASLSDQDMLDIANYFASLDGTARPSLVNEQKAKRGKEKAATCAACHGPTGATPTTPAFPKLAGQYDSYLTHALKDYRSGERQNAVMNGIAKTMTIEDIQALSAWFSSQTEGTVTAPATKIFKFN